LNGQVNKLFPSNYVEEIPMPAARNDVSKIKQYILANGDVIPKAPTPQSRFVLLRTRIVLLYEFYRLVLLRSNKEQVTDF